MRESISLQNVATDRVLTARSTKESDSIENVPTFIFKRHTALTLVKNSAQLHRNILNELKRLGLSDYCFGNIKSSRFFGGPLSTMPQDFIDYYDTEDFYHDDQVVGYLLANNQPTFRTVIEQYIERAPVKTHLIERNQELISFWRNFGFLECYLIPVNRDGSTFIVSAKYDAPEEMQNTIENYIEELGALGRVIRHVCLQKFPDIIRTAGFESTPIAINQRPLEVLAALANGCPTVYAVAAELNISINTANHHIATAKAALGATSLPHAIAIAVRQGLI